jgi:Ala-tRNA(Pro) deacylase
MAMARSLAKLLKVSRIPYVVFTHPPAYGAQQRAAASHVRGRCWAKVVICFADGRPLLAVLPAHFTINLDQLRSLVGAQSIRLASEQETALLYPDCAVGAVPPFGSIYGHPVYVEQSFVGEPEMVFNAGTHQDAVCMHYWDFADVEKPVVGRFGQHAKLDRPASPFSRDAAAG